MVERKQMEFPVINNDNFDEIVSEAATLVIFSSPDCGYCHLVKENIKEIKGQLQNLDIYECNIKDAEDIVQKYKVTSIPIIKLFKDGQPVYTGYGVVKATDLYYNLLPYII